MSPSELVSKRRVEILALAERHGAHNVRVFGSVARGEERDDSDIDFLVDFDHERSLLDYVALTQDLEELLGKKVELAQPDSLHHLVREHVLHDARPL